MQVAEDMDEAVLAQLEDAQRPSEAAATRRCLDEFWDFTDLFFLCRDISGWEDEHHEGEQRTIKPLCPYMSIHILLKAYFCLLSHCVSDCVKHDVITLLSRASKIDGQRWCLSFPFSGIHPNGKL